MAKTVDLLNADINYQKAIASTKAFGKQMSAGFDAAAKRGEQRFNQMGKNISARMAKVSTEMKASFTGAFAGFGAANLVSGALSKITGAFSSAITLAKEFEAELANVKAITGVSDEVLGKFADSARRLALTFGGEAKDQLNSFKGILSKLGPDIAKNPPALEAMTKSINTLAKAGGLEATVAMESLANTMLQFAIPLDDQTFAAEEMARVMNVLAAGAKEGASEIPQSAEAILRFGALAKASNISIEESAAAIQTLSKSAGLFGSDAGTAMRNAILALTKPTGDAIKDFKKMV
jgi:TP901 family phage tail tape measure protein